MMILMISWKPALMTFIAYTSPQLIESLADFHVVQLIFSLPFFLFPPPPNLVLINCQ